MTTTTYVGIVNGMAVWEVRDDDGNLIGTNQSVPADVADVPASVSARQIRLWLVRSGISLAAVDAAIAAIPDQMTRDSVRVEWEYAPYIERGHAMLVPLAAAIGLTEAQVDQAFREAVVI